MKFSYWKLNNNAQLLLYAYGVCLVFRLKSNEPACLPGFNKRQNRQFLMFVFIHVYVFPFTFHSIASGLLFSEMSRVDVEVTAKWPLVCC